MTAIQVEERDYIPGITFSAFLCKCGNCQMCPKRLTALAVTKGAFEHG